MKWIETSGVLCDMRFPIRIKDTFLLTVISPTMVNGQECCALDRKTEQIMTIAKTSMLRGMNEITEKDRIRNEYMRGRCQQ